MTRHYCEKETPVSDYAAACEQATTTQGLDLAVQALRAAGLPVYVEQTGGMTMVATVVSGANTWGVIADGQNPDRPWLAVLYTTEAWLEGLDSTATHPDLTTGELVALLKENPTP
jgi:hypothetical protein